LNFGENGQIIIAPIIAMQSLRPTASATDKL